MRRKSLFQIEQIKDDSRFPWRVTAGGYPATKHLTKAEALKKVRSARKKEKSLIEGFLR